jgi:hypothetical protein
MQLPDELTPEGHAAIVAAIKIFAARGRALREAREREQAAQPEPKPTVTDEHAAGLRTPYENHDDAETVG